MKPSLMRAIFLFVLLFGLAAGRPAAPALAQTPEPGEVKSTPLPSEPAKQVTEVVNKPPVVNAGPDLIASISEGASLSATVTDDGIPGTLSYLWQKASGPGVVEFSAPWALSTHARFSQAGVYELTFAASESGVDGWVYDSVMVDVVEGQSNPGSRALIVLDSYSYGADSVVPGSTFELTAILRNIGDRNAINGTVTFDGGAEFIPTGTGGVRGVQEVQDGGSSSVSQSFIASSSLLGNKVGLITMTVAYTDTAGGSYTEKFTLSIGLKGYGTGPAVPTATPTQTGRAQVVVSGYKSDITPLQPGTIFNLEVDVRNLGIKNANDVSMVLGGGTAAVDNGQGTPVPGGISGSGSDLAVFAPLGQSNVVFIDDLAAGAEKSVSNQLIVNVTANPGAYPFKISFIYTDEKNQRVVEDQVITLLVYKLPQVEVSFYRDPGEFFVGQPMPLPLQATNLGKTLAVLGNMKVTAEGAEVANNVMLVGSLEPGGYFPLDAMLTPMQPGTIDVVVTINYTDDFNQTREIKQTLSVNVVDMPAEQPMEPGVGPDGQVPGMEGPGGMPGGVPGVNANETLWQKIVRAVKGLLGLDSGPAQPSQPEGMPMPGEEIIPEGEGKPIGPIPKG